MKSIIILSIVVLIFLSIIGVAIWRAIVNKGHILAPDNGDKRITLVMICANDSCEKLPTELQQIRATILNGKMISGSGLKISTVEITIEGFDEEIVNELKNRANTALIAQALSLENIDSGIMALEGMTADIAQQLQNKGIKTLEDVAELDVEELTLIPGVSEKNAGKWIMKAREPWFKDNQ